MGKSVSAGAQMALIAKVSKPSATAASAQAPDAPAELIEYYDAGNHWCKNCNVTSGSMFDFFTHLHSKTHRKTLDPYDRPWAPKSETEKKRPTGEHISKPAKGSEFMLPVRGFFCQLCEEFFGDPICAEVHITCQKHNEKYKKQTYENPLYEQRRNLDRQAGLESERKVEHKRKHDDDDDDDPQDDNKKSKLIKDEGKREEDKPKYSKEGEQKAKYIKEEEKPKYRKEEEEQHMKFKREEEKQKSRKEEDERIKYRKEEEERARHAREGEERGKYRKEQEDRYRPKKEDEERHRSEEERSRYRDESRYRYREDDDMYRHRKEEERSRYGREDEKKYRYGRETEEDRRQKYREDEGVKWPKSKWEDEEEEKSRDEKKDDKWQRQKAKAGRSKDVFSKTSAKDGKTEPEKPSEPPKVLCGPSPAMLAKLRKKNEETTGRPAFGKFTWKKAEKTALEKEAERIAAQFTKEDEESVAAAQDASKDSEDPDAFAKSLAVAKNIAIKLAGKTVLPPSQEWVAYNQNKICPTLPPTSNVLRKSNIGPQNKPATPNTFPPVGPTAATVSNSPGPALKDQTQKEGVLSADLISKAFGGQDVELKVSGNNLSNLPPTSSSLTATSMPSPTTAFIPPPAAPFMPPPAASSMPPPTSTMTKVEAIQLKAPPECVISLESDVAAPGVPEEEQNLTVVVRPPPQLQMSSSSKTSKLSKPKTSLAAAKAKDLFDIFYSGSSTMGSSSVAGASNKFATKSNSKANSKDQMPTQSKAGKNSTKAEDPATGESPAVTQSKCEESSVDRGKKSASLTVSKGSLGEEPQKDKGPLGKDPQVAKGSLDKEPQRNERSLDEETQVGKSSLGKEAAAVDKGSHGEEQPLVEKTSKTLEISQNEETNCESMEIIDPTNEATSLDCEASSTILENIEIMEVSDNQDGETPLDPEEAMTVSFSPPPGSFTEQLNLDTFEFNFDSL